MGVGGRRGQANAMVSSSMKIKTLSDTRAFMNFISWGTFFRKIMENEVKGEEAEHKRLVKG